ncbi:uncharacterized protein TRIVIDRAFT_60528 [Trichoderma virens Gv29-8]|uniref:Uncharacterized protein n=1 Tax=Hypocrea virens (strain Gv29-8 / FGSC 10586) TaxID=413071 RepID=G9MRA3_HYPVG|nr:uncharacterized protein TRIVIDRAFT_60528 [Trichoderma virens Gv29-8]EHK22627.1 hypothetical protein TRIVIDRAFT_60528 [Trichoderma virens Gv29-8]UKZ47678.1 hypothetical protein TrVGV298_001904 [Trichoderma virens]UKZ74239.1 hypothetical protein TrVFT333_001901 [Trichoderma virens FT-333]
MSSPTSSTASGRITDERMMHLRAESKLRQKLIQAIEKTAEQLQIVREQIDLLRNQRFEIDRQIMTYETRLRLRAEVQDNVDAKESEAEELREQLATAVHELEDYDETTQLKSKDLSSAASDEEY